MPLSARAADICATAAERAAGLSTVSTIDAADIDHAPRMTESQRALLAAGGTVEVGDTTYDVSVVALVATTVGIVALGLLIFGGCVAVGLGVVHLIDTVWG